MEIEGMHIIWGKLRECTKLMEISEVLIAWPIVKLSRILSNKQDFLFVYTVCLCNDISPLVPKALKQNK